jgi:hypothetical protein
MGISSEKGNDKMLWYYESQNYCCGGHDYMIVAGLGHIPVAITCVSGTCGGYIPMPRGARWFRASKTIKSSKHFWKKNYFKKCHTGWEAINEVEALSIAPELSF